MRRFQFRLEQLLELRRYREREWELKLARITGICLKIRLRIKEIDEVVRRSIASLFRSDVLTDYSYLISNELYMMRLRGERKEREEELEKREKEREEVQKEYITHSKKRKVLQKLKEKQEEEYYVLLRKEEFMSVDDINNGLFTRKKKDV